jgi:hypothetical protein
MPLTVRNMDGVFDEYAAIISVSGKTVFRKVKVLGYSILYLIEGQNAHLNRTKWKKVGTLQYLYAPDKGTAWFQD